MQYKIFELKTPGGTIYLIWDESAKAYATEIFYLTREAAESKIEKMLK